MRTSEQQDRSTSLDKAHVWLVLPSLSVFFIILTLLGPAPSSALILPPSLRQIQCSATAVDDDSHHLSPDQERMIEWRNGYPESGWFLTLSDFFGFDIAILPFSSIRNHDGQGPVQVRIEDHETGAATEALMSWAVDPQRPNSQRLSVKFFRPAVKGNEGPRQKLSPPHSRRANGENPNRHGNAVIVDCWRQRHR